MPEVLLGLGSNIDPEKNLDRGVAKIRSLMREVILSPVYGSTSVGFDGDDFLNFVLLAETDLPLNALAAALKEIEFELGKIDGAPKFSSRSLDIDILSYEDLVGEFDGVVLPRDEITKNAFVLKPLADLVPEALHPSLKQSYADLWSEFASDEQKIWPSAFSL